MDERGTKIEATIKPKLIWRSANHVKEFASIIISKFSLIKNSGSFKFSTHPHKIVFTDGTIVASCAGLGIAQHGLHFQDFSSISSPGDYLIDVIGELIEFTDIISSEKEDKSTNKRMVIHLEDQNHKDIPCTLWGDYAIEMSGYINSFKGRRVIVILQFGKVILYNGNLSVSTYWFGSRLILDQDHPEIAQFKAIVFPDGDLDSRTITHVTTPSYTSVLQKFLQVNEFTNLLQLETMREDGFAVFLATIVAFQKPDTWWFQSCLSCKRQVETDGVRFYCVRCDQAVDIPGQRFMLQIEVNDDTGTTSLMMFDTDVQSIVHTSVKALREKQANLGDVDAFPDELKVLLNKIFLFRIEVSAFYVSKGKPHTIQNIAGDQSLIDQFKSASLSIQDTHSDAASYDKLALPVAASSDKPSVSITPHKREYVEVDSGEENDEYQLSTTKQKIIVKVKKDEE